MALEEVIAQQARISLATSGASCAALLCTDVPYCGPWRDLPVVDAPCQIFFVLRVPLADCTPCSYQAWWRRAGLATGKALVHVIEWRSPLRPDCVQIIPGRTWALGIGRGRLQKPQGRLEDSLRVLQASQMLPACLPQV